MVAARPMSDVTTYFILGLLFVAVAEPNEADHDYHMVMKKAILIEPNYTGLDCYFGKNEKCFWTWDKDNFTDSSYNNLAKPGQHGYIRLDSQDIERYYTKWNKKFYGPYYDPQNKTGKQQFLSSNWLVYMAKITLGNVIEGCCIFLAPFYSPKPQ